MGSTKVVTITNSDPKAFEKLLGDFINTLDPYTFCNIEYSLLQLEKTIIYSALIIYGEMWD